MIVNSLRYNEDGTPSFERELMALLTHQLLIPSDLASLFESQRMLLPFESFCRGFAWYLCPVVVAKEQQWVLINVAFGFVELLDVMSPPTANAVEKAAFDVIELASPLDREEDNVSVSFNPADVTWHIADKLPTHVGKQYQRVEQALRQCHDIYEADEVIKQINAKPMTIGDQCIAPVEGVYGVLLELADDFRDYVQTTPWWKQLWHLSTKQTPWLDP